MKDLIEKNRCIAKRIEIDSNNFVTLPKVSSLVALKAKFMHSEYVNKNPI